MSTGMKVVASAALTTFGLWPAIAGAAPDDEPPVEDETAYDVLAGANGKTPTLVVEIERPGSEASPNSVSRPVPVKGEGAGGTVECSSRPMASAADLAAVAAAVEAGTSAAPADPNVVEDVIQGPGQGAVVETSWFRMIGGVPHVRSQFTCPPPAGIYRELVPVAASGGTFVPQPRAADLVPDLYERVVRQLPTPVPKVAPAEWLPQQWTYVHLSTFFWVEQVAGQWAAGGR